MGGCEGTPAQKGMNYQLRIKPLAEEDIQSAVDWYDIEQPGLGDGFIIALDQQFNLLLALLLPGFQPLQFLSHTRGIFQRQGFPVVFNGLPRILHRFVIAAQALVNPRALRVSGCI